MYDFVVWSSLNCHTCLGDDTSLTRYFSLRRVSAQRSPFHDLVDGVRPLSLLVTRGRCRLNRLCPRQPDMAGGNGCRLRFGRELRFVRSFHLAPQTPCRIGSLFAYPSFLPPVLGFSSRSSRRRRHSSRLPALQAASVVDVDAHMTCKALELAAAAVEGLFHGRLEAFPRGASACWRCPV